MPSMSEPSHETMAAMACGGLQSRIEILKIHASKITKREGEGNEIDYEAVVKLADGAIGPSTHPSWPPTTTRPKR